MSFLQYFSDSYDEARHKFIAVAGEKNALCAQYENPHAGPSGETLATNVALIGPAGARKLLVVLSGTHGVEFLGGGGCQTGWLSEFPENQLPDGTAVVLIHAVNPHGAAWNRRFNEDNIDLNRNFVDHSKPHFENPHYPDIHDCLTPEALSGPAREDANLKLKRYRETHGERAYQIGFLGQYSHPDGFYYGGREPTWSNRIVRQIVNDYCHDRDQVAVIDLHTGLGPFGYGMVGILAQPGSTTGIRAYRWFGRAATTFAEAGQHIGYLDYSQFEEGFLLQAFNQELKDVDLTLAGIEFGTFPMDTVTNAEIEDIWLFNHPGAPPEVAAKIRSEMRRVYYPNTSDWHEMIWWRFNQVIQQALSGLGE